MLLAVILIIGRLLALEREDVLRDEAPYRHVADALRLPALFAARQARALGRVDKHLELDDARALDHRRAHPAHQLDPRAQRAAGGDEVVDEEHAVAALDDTDLVWYEVDIIDEDPDIVIYYMDIRSQLLAGV